LKKEKNDLVYGSLLHAIGKVIQGSRCDEKDLGTIGSEWFRRFSDNEKIILREFRNGGNYGSKKFLGCEWDYCIHEKDTIVLKRNTLYIR